MVGELEKIMRDEQSRTVISSFINRAESPYDYERQLLLNHRERVNAVLDGKIVPPNEVEIQPTSKCNFKCWHCFGQHLSCGRLENKIGFSEMKILADRIDEYKDEGFKIETVKFCGTTGEPLVNSATVQGIIEFKELEKKVVLFTNASLLDLKRKGADYLDYVIKADKTIISWDAGSKQIFWELKESTDFDRVVGNTAELVSRRNRTGSNLDINVGFVVGGRNYKDIVKATKLAGKIGVDRIGFRVDFTSPKEIMRLSDDIKSYLSEAKGYAREDFEVLSVYSDDEIGGDESAFNSDGRKCFNQHFWACIGPDANLYACGHRTYCGVESYGSLLENSFRDLWLGEKRKENLKNLPDKKCVYCSPSSTRRNTFMTYCESRCDNGSELVKLSKIENEFR